MIARGRWAVVLLFCLSALWLVATAVVIATLQFEFGDWLIWILVLSGVIWAALVFWVGIPIWAGVYALRLVRAGWHNRAVGWAFIPALAIGTIFFGVPLSGMIWFAAEYNSFRRIADDLSYGKCAKEDMKHWAVAPEFVDCDNPPLVLFDWGGIGSGWYGIIYDASDEIAKPSRDRSASWKQRDVGSLLSCSGTSAYLGGHFYFAGGSFASSANECD